MWLEVGGQRGFGRPYSSVRTVYLLPQHLIVKLFHCWKPGRNPDEQNNNITGVMHTPNWKHNRPLEVPCGRKHTATNTPKNHRTQGAACAQALQTVASNRARFTTQIACIRLFLRLRYVSIPVVLTSRRTIKSAP